MSSPPHAPGRSTLEEPCDSSNRSIERDTTQLEELCVASHSRRLLHGSKNRTRLIVASCDAPWRDRDYSLPNTRERSIEPRQLLREACCFPLARCLAEKGLCCRKGGHLTTRSPPGPGRSGCYPSFVIAPSRPIDTSAARLSSMPRRFAHAGTDRHLPCRFARGALTDALR